MEDANVVSAKINKTKTSIDKACRISNYLKTKKK